MFVFNFHHFIIFSFLHFKLLNEKNDDEDDETRPGVKKRNELLQQLMKDPDEERKLQEQQVCFSIANFISILFSLAAPFF